MLIVLLVIFIVLTGLCMFFDALEGWWEAAWPFGWLSGLFAIVVVAIGIVCTASSLASISVIPDKIAVLETQNHKIEAEVNGIVESYLGHEGETYTELTPDNTTVFAVAYPQLSSNETVKKQMDLYIQNNQSITDLKLEMCNARIYKWWLYFGK